MMKTSKSIEFTIQLKMGRAGVSGDSRTERNSKYKLNSNKIDGVEVDGVEVADNKFEKKDQKMLKSKKLHKSKKMVRSLNFFTPRARLAFTKLGQIFIKALILQHFDPKRHISIEMDISGYAIGEILSQLILNNSS